jgi:hypothetical protein
MYRTFFFWSLWAMLFSGSVHAQDKATERPPVESLWGQLAFQVGAPTLPMQRAIRNQMGDIGFGAGLTVLSNPFSWGRNKRNSPFKLGAELGYTYYGRFLSDVNINGYNGSYKTSYGILNLNAIARVSLSHMHRITPFAEVLAGGNFYLSRTHENLSVIESALGIQSFDLDNFASVGFNKGLAAGIVVGRRQSGTGVVLRVSYNVGSDIKYIVRNSLTYDASANQLTYNISKAPVKYFMIQLGIGGF